MRHTRILLLAGLLASVATGCASYTHERTAQGVERTTFNAFLYMGKASKVNSSTTDGTYKRSVSIGTIQGQGDAATINAIAEAAYKLGTEAGKAAVGAP